ncbi:hypothetical protein COCNU_scaffold040430G000010 [Cocos nucifera]|nr:hypothetical protein [Cocos nucifera]
MDEEEELGSMSSFSEDEFSSNSTGSSASEFVEDAASSNSCASSYVSTSSSSNDHPQEGPLYEMSSLIAQLPLNCRRGLSRHFQGKSQSFACLSNVRCLEDLAKPEKPYRKKLKSSKSYGGGLDSHKALAQKACSRTITKKASKGSFSSLSGTKQSFLGSRPPAHPKRIASFSDRTLLFA